MDDKISQSILIRLGGEIALPAERIVSLVPSLSESVFFLGAGETLVGRTDYCDRPAGEIEDVKKVGGPKSVDVKKVFALDPDVILASREENEKEQVIELSKKFPVLLVDPDSPIDTPLIWEALGEIVGRQEKAMEFAEEVKRELEKLRDIVDDSDSEAPSFIYFVWKDPWIAAGHDTYISKMLSLAGMKNALDEKHRRFPQMKLEEADGAGADVHFYCSEPWAFKLPEDILKYANESADKLEENWFVIGDTFAAYVDAESLSWYPSRATEGLRYVGALREKLETWISKLSR